LIRKGDDWIATSLPLLAMTEGIKSSPALLYERREKDFPLLQRGKEGDFLASCSFDYLSSQLFN
jgi:hypothetical protein